MANTSNNTNLAALLLQQDTPLADGEYQNYRSNLEQALQVAEWRERWVCRIVAASCTVALLLMFVGGTRWVGDFDPWSQKANLLSSTLGVIYLVSVVVFPVSLASYYSRFRPQTREARQQLRDLVLLDLQRQIHDLAEQVRKISQRSESNGPPAG